MSGGSRCCRTPTASGPCVDRTTYTWDAGNRLLAIRQSNLGAVDLTNTYRPDGLRHQRTDSSTTQIVWDGDDPLAQVDTSGNLKEFWSWAPQLPDGRWSRLVKNRYPVGTTNPDQYAHCDWRGTLIALSLPNGMALTTSGGAFPWGQEVASMGPFSWLGSRGYWSENQLARPMHYVRARWYVDGNVSMVPGWLSPDPLGFGGGDWNLYRYARNRPTVAIDPSGRWHVGPVPAGFVLPPGADAATGCNEAVGQMFTQSREPYPQCDAPCTDAHEGQHRADEGPCCARLKACRDSAGNSAAGLQACENAYYGLWYPRIRAWTECQAYRSGRLCREQMAGCRGCGKKARGADRCCDDLHDGIGRDNDFISYCCQGSGWPRLPRPDCPFSPTGDILQSVVSTLYQWALPDPRCT